MEAAGDMGTTATTDSDSGPVEGSKPCCCPLYHEAVELVGRRWTGAILLDLATSDRQLQLVAGNGDTVRIWVGRRAPGEQYFLGRASGNGTTRTPTITESGAPSARSSGPALPLASAPRRKRRWMRARR